MKKAVLIIMDGFGIAPATPGNAITTANTPNLDALNAAYPHAQLMASGLDVGLPEGQMGNSIRISAQAVSSSRFSRR